MAIRARENLIGARAFFVGVILALLAGIFSIGSGSIKLQQILLIVLFFLGIIVGLFVPEKDVKTFLLASVALVVVSYAGISGLVLRAAIIGVFDIGKIVSSILGALLVLCVPVATIVALKTVFSIAQS